MPRDETIKAIPTRYNNLLFRSRLEARWAMVLDGLKIMYTYEHEGYDLPRIGYYLPDFWMPQVKMFAEVKPAEADHIAAVKPDVLDKMIGLAQLTGRSVLYFDGTPRDVNYWAVESHPPDEKTWGWCDYVLTDPNSYHTTEGRFYGCTGEALLTHVENPWPTHPAIVAARMARFGR